MEEFFWSDGATPTLAVAGFCVGRKPDADFRIWLRDKYEQHDAPLTRYQELIAILRNQSTLQQT